MSQGRALTAQSRARFLEHLAETANVTASAASVGVHRNTLYDHKAADPEFAAAWSAALEAATDALEAEARRRAMEGTQEYLTCKDGLIYDERGNPVMQRRFSDTLMIQLLRAHRPEKFRDGAASASAVAVSINVTSDDAAL